MAYIEFVIPLENALTTDPVQAMFCGSTARMAEALRSLDSIGLGNASPSSAPNILCAIFP